MTHRNDRVAAAGWWLCVVLAALCAAADDVREAAAIDAAAASQTLSLLVHPDCAHAVVSWPRAIGVNVTCVESRSPSSTAAAAWRPLVASMPTAAAAVNVTADSEARVTVTASDHPQVQSLTFSTRGAGGRAVLTFSEDPLQFLAQLSRLTVRNMDLSDRDLDMMVPAALEEMEFTGSALATLPGILSERRYRQRLTVVNLRIAPGLDNNPLRLNATFYANTFENIDAEALVASTNVRFVGNCTERARIPSKVLQVCMDATLPEDAEGREEGSVYWDTSDSTAEPTTTSSSGLSTGVVVAIVAVSVIALIAIAWAIARWKRWSCMGSLDASDKSNALLETSDTSSTAARHGARLALEDEVALSLDEPAIQALRLSMDDLVVGELLSEGAFGKVYRGTFQHREPVAVKRLSVVRQRDAVQVICFLSEAKLMASLSHERIVTFLGIAWTVPTDLHVVTELLDGGDLRSLLARYKQQRAPTGFNTAKLRIASHIAEALVYLHSRTPAILHRDLKSNNVLLTKEPLSAKLVDFGVARPHAESTLTVGVGTLRWMAPEVMLGGRYAAAADVFSFGIVLSELDTHELPYHGVSQEMTDAAIMTRVALGALHVEFSLDADADVVALARACTAFEPSDRPSTQEVCHRMHSLLTSHLELS
ncbi:hypothetical protein P43SY_004531 [Pythium insidiosum]|uniref:Protein kinase domain-containing protein n=1 Tax=Pythium insidiosum TaxID=114742 RepID=A0AAD5M8L7_PYTIN|nr:hypothetical protein P43SY_004531 [Pythium insidiosum]